VPLVQVPPRGVWGAGGQAKYARLESWTGLELGKRSATLAIRPHHKLSRAEHAEVAAEAGRMVDFAASDVDRRDVRFEPAVD
jgi:hypothetical protein